MTFPATPIVHAAASGANSSTTPARDTTTANLIVVSVAFYNGVTTPGALTDSKGNTWTKLTTYAINSVAQVLYYAAGSLNVGSGHTFTFTGVSTFSTISMQAWSGADASPFDQQNGATNGSVASSIQPGSVTPSTNDQLVITGIAFSAGSGASFTINGGFTISDQTDFGTGDHEGGAMAYLVQTTAAAANPTWQDAQNQAELCAAIATFKCSTGGGGGSAIVPILNLRRMMDR